MKKLLLFLLLIFVAVAGFSQIVVVYEDTAELTWNPVTLFDDGSVIEYLPGDELTYSVYYYDVMNPVLDNQDVLQLEFAGSTTNNYLTIVFPIRKAWALGIASKFTDGGGTSGPQGRISWSTEEEYVDVAVMGGPFYIIPLSPVLPPEGPTGLRDLRF